jgi:hypothetical protein
MMAIEHSGTHNGLPFLIRKGTEEGHNHRCGYVAVTKGHPLYGKDYDHDDCSRIDVHGGLTFTDTMEDQDPALWWLGFDTAHGCDRDDPKSRDYVELQCVYLSSQLAEIARLATARGE